MESEIKKYLKYKRISIKQILKNEIISIETENHSFKFKKIDSESSYFLCNSNTFQEFKQEKKVIFLSSSFEDYESFDSFIEYSKLKFIYNDLIYMTGIIKKIKFIKE